LKWPHPYACELDALDPDTFRGMVRSCIERHLPHDELERLKVIEEAERETFAIMARSFGHVLNKPKSEKRKLDPNRVLEGEELFKFMFDMLLNKDK
jgi:hypothetical protein